KRKTGLPGARPDLESRKGERGRPRRKAASPRRFETRARERARDEERFRMATIGASIPCIELPNPKPLKISLPFGGDLKSVIDISKGPPSDCTLIHGLMLQLAPALASMECFLKVLKVVQAMSNISVTSLPDIAKAVGEMLACFNVFAKIPCMIVDVLKVIIAYLKCIIEGVESIFKFQIGINFGAAAGNPVLLASLNCAQNNANAS